MIREYKVNQENTAVLSFSLVDDSNVAIPLSALNLLSLTLYYYNATLTTSDPYHLTTINSRNTQNVKNQNNVVVSAEGLVTWTMQSADNIKLNSDLNEEIHVALFVWTYASSTKKNSLELVFRVKKVEFM